VVEALEPRLLYSADLGPSLLGTVMPPVAEQRLLESEPPAVQPQAATAQTQAREVVFVDAATPDADRLIADIASQPGRAIDVVRIGADEDGLARIGAELAARQDVSAVHIISHGSDGAVYLGRSVLDQQSLQARSGEIAAWGSSLTADGDLLLYGCDVAQSADGQALVDQLAALTGADVAASSNLTGTAALGGDFTLEFRTGAIEAQTAISAASTLDWRGLLAVTADTSSSAATNKSENSLSFSHTVSASGSDSFLLVTVGTVNGAQNVTSVTYGGASLTRIGGITDASGKVSTDLWYMKAPATGTADVVVTLAGDASISAGATTFFGVDQTTPYSATAFAQGGGGTASVTLASAPGELVVDGVVGDAISTFNVGANQTQLWSELTGNTPKDPWNASSTEAGAASVTVSWTKTGTGVGHWASGALSLRAAGPNAAPVLSGASDLGTILEDSAANPGTLVSALLAGHVSDADSGALTGIAVTGVDNTNGAWQYSTDGGSTWTAFASPTAATARLLAADGNTYVRFMPNANFNGTVVNGLTFRAWDQTTGVNGGTADTTSASLTVGDTFTAASYANNDGTASWTTNWVDADGNPAAGNIRVTGGDLVLSTFLGTESVYRQVDLSAASGASLSFSYDNQLGLLGTVSLQASNDGGATYSTLATFSSGANTGAGTYTADLGAYLASDTRIRFEMSGTLLGGSFHVDNVEVAYTTPLSGGTTAFSASTASSSIAVASVNDAPAGASNTVTTLEDTAYVFAATDFGFSDSDGNAFAAVKIAAPPVAGTLTNNGVAVSAGQTVSAADIAAGLLRFTPAPNANGAGYATFTFQVQDDGGTANGGIDLDPVARTLTVNVTAVNDAPAGVSNTVTTLEDTAYVFAAADFGFSDADGNAFAGVKIATLPGAGTLSDNGVAVVAGQTVSAADIAAGLLSFIAAPNANGAGYAAFTFQVQDNGGTANGGVDLDPTARTMTVNVTPVNDAPIGKNVSVTALEDTPYVFAQADFGFSDPDGNSLLAVRIASLPTAGALTDNGVAVSLGQSVSATDIAAGLLSFTPAPDANGAGYATFKFQVRDNGGTANGGVDFDPAVRTMTVDVTPVNDAPSGANNTVTTLEDTAYVFATADFGFTDVDGGALTAVKIASLPAAGTLTNNGVSPASGQWVSAADIAAGLLRFTPAANANGAGYAAFTFQVQDDGGTANGGVAIDPTARTMTVNVTAVNDAPSGANNVVTTLENSAYVFAASDFGFSDTDGNTLAAVKIASVPTAGVLTNNGAAVSAGQTVSTADIAAGLLRFTPVANASGAGYTSFSFQVQDDGGTANGGVDLDPTARTMTVNVAAVNDAPTGTNTTVTMVEDGVHVFATADFGFSDADGNALAAVRIASVPAAGTLTNNGVAVSAGQRVSAADIASGLLRFTPAANANGAGYASFSFQVQDDGGTANGGVDIDPIARTITVDVTGVNDAPSGANNTVTAIEDGAYVFTTADFGFGDIDGNALAAVRIGALPGVGALTDNGVAVTAGQSVSAADIAAGLLRFTPAPNANGAGYASFTFQVQDDGGTANGGADLDPVARTMSVDVAAVNDAPSGASNTVTALEDGAHVFTAADFGFSDVDGNALAGVKIAALPGAGALTNNGVAVSAGQVVSAADIAAGLLRFTPAANANGAGYASFTFQVQDDGGTANGGVDLDPIARTMSVNVTPVNDAPTGANNTVVMQQDGVYAFSAADFGFSDSDGNAFAGVVIAAVPPGGLITDNGAPVAAGQTVSAGDIAAGLVRYTPTVGASGMPYASFAFRVQDSGGTVNGGADTDAVARTMTINVISAAAVGPVVGPVPVPAPPAPVQSQPPVSPAPVATGGSSPALTAQTPPGAGSARLLLASNDVLGTRVDVDEGFRFQTVAAQSLASVFATAQRLVNAAPVAGPGFGSSSSVPVSEDKQFEFQLFGSMSVSDRASGGSRAAGLAGDLDRMRDDMGEQADLHHWVSGSIAVGSFGLTVGYVLWLLRGGALLASLLSSLPAWRLIDPLPVLSRVDEEEDSDEDQDAFVSFDETNAPFPMGSEKS
jgi:hypothetical protein